MSLRDAMNRILCDAATRERDSRERGFPALIEAGKITREDAEAQLAAWRAMVDLFARGYAERDISWSELHLATSRCLQALERDVERAQGGDPDKLRKLIERRDLVDAIHTRIDHHKHLFDDTTAELRQHAAEQAKAA